MEKIEGIRLRFAFFRPAGVSFRTHAPSFLLLLKHEKIQQFQPFAANEGLMSTNCPRGRLRLGISSESV